MDTGTLPLETRDRVNMPKLAHPTEAKPIVALFCTRGMEAFLSNSIRGILQVGIEPAQIYVGCPDNALKSVSSVTARHSIQIRVISNHRFSENEAEMETYSRYGSHSFKDISWKKIAFIRELLNHHNHVVYSDLDVAWIRNPLPYLSQVALVYPMAFQTEGLPRFPPALCCGFVSFLKSERTTAFLDALIEFDSTQSTGDDRLSDQPACQQMIENDVTWLQDIFCLPEALFLNGLGYRNLQGAGQSPCSMAGELSPFIFHANWTVGVDNKRELMARTGTWLIGNFREPDPKAIARGSSGESVPRTEPRAPSAARVPLLSVIYPVFDTRGDVIERIRLWTEEQELEPDRYRVFVVAGPEADLDEARLRDALRAHDVILRVPDAGREADYWNAGARAATTPWLLFVEAHGMPRPDSLSALAAWIEANPDGEACNFRIENIEQHRVAKLMKRWFAQIHTDWAAPTTWRRLHRTAFAIRRDVFEDIGPIESEYGQFAPPLLSARMHQRGMVLATVPTSSVIHDDSPEMSAHHDDTANYVRGEMDARSRNDPVFFEKYFGSSPLHGQPSILPARYARTMLKGLVVAALRQPGNGHRLLRQAAALFPAALLGLRHRARLLAVLTRVDERVVMHMPLLEGLRWRRFLLAHRRVICTEQMLWLVQHPSPPLQMRAGDGRWPIDEIGQHAIVGVHPLEQSGDENFRWTHPVFLLRLALLATKASVTFETRNLRAIALSDIVVLVGGRTVASEDFSIDQIGNTRLQIRRPPAQPAETDIVVVVRAMRESNAGIRGGRVLGLPLFSVSFTAP